MWAADMGKELIICTYLSKTSRSSTYMSEKEWKEVWFKTHDLSLSLQKAASAKTLGGVKRSRHW
jgi:hypothetical protein